MQDPPEPKYPTMHSHASPSLFSSELVGHAQSENEVDPVPPVLAPAGQLVHPRAFPALLL